MMLRGVGSGAGAGVRAGAGALAVALCCACGGAASSELLDGTGSGETSDGGGAPADSGSHDATASTDARADGGDQGVHCPNSGYCPVPGEVCCRQSAGDTCTAAGACSGLAIPCDDSTDCAAAGMPGDVCCVLNGQNGVASSVQCMAAGQCLGMMGRTAICDRSGPNICPSGQSCQPSEQALPGFDICR